MEKIHYNNTFNNFQNFNPININNTNNNNVNNNRTCYIPYADNTPINFFPNKQKEFQITYNQNIMNSYSYQNQLINNNINNALNIQNNFNNKINNINIIKNNNIYKKEETDADLIQDLTGNFLNDNDESYSEDKIDKNEIEINLGKIVIENEILNDFPIIELKNKSKYDLMISKNILLNDDFFTAIKDVDKDDEKNGTNEMNIEEEDIKEKEEKILIKDDYILPIDENIYNNLKYFMTTKEINLYLNNKEIMLKKIIEILYDKCISIISDIKRNIKNRVKKSKNYDLSSQLLNIFKLHNELYSKFLLNNNKKSYEKQKEYYTYVKYYIDNNNGKKYKCEICDKEFINFQKLGGHMSKMHPNCSEKYEKRTNIRKQREGNRKVLDYVKEKLFEKYKLDYRKMKKNDEKDKIKNFIKSHQKEYEILRRKIYRENALKHGNED